MLNERLKVFRWNRPPVCAGALLILASNLREGRLPLMKLLHSSKDRIIMIYNISQVRKKKFASFLFFPELLTVPMSAQWRFPLQKRTFRLGTPLLHTRGPTPPSSGSWTIFLCLAGAGFWFWCFCSAKHSLALGFPGATVLQTITRYLG